MHRLGYCVLIKSDEEEGFHQGIAVISENGISRVLSP
jgi:hypothetical protein